MSKHLLLATHDLTHAALHDELLGFLEDANPFQLLEGIKTFYQRKPRGSCEKIFGLPIKELTVTRVTENLHAIRKREPLLLSAIVFGLLYHHEPDLLAAKQLEPLEHCTWAWRQRLKRVAELLPESFFADIVPRPQVQPSEAWTKVQPILTRLEARFADPKVLDLFQPVDQTQLFAFTKYAITRGLASAALEARAQYLESKATLGEQQALIDDLRFKLKQKTTKSSNDIASPGINSDIDARTLQNQINILEQQLAQEREAHKLELETLHKDEERKTALATGNIERIKVLESRLEQSKQSNANLADQVKTLEVSLKTSLQQRETQAQYLFDARAMLKSQRTSVETETLASQHADDNFQRRLALRMDELESRFEQHLSNAHSNARDAKPPIQDTTQLQIDQEDVRTLTAPPAVDFESPRLSDLTRQALRRILNEAQAKFASLNSGRFNDQKLFSIESTFVLNDYSLEQLQNLASGFETLALSAECLLDDVWSLEDLKERLHWAAIAQCWIRNRFGNAVVDQTQQAMYRVIRDILANHPNMFVPFLKSADIITKAQRLECRTALDSMMNLETTDESEIHWEQLKVAAQALESGQEYAQESINAALQRLAHDQVIPGHLKWDGWRSRLKGICNPADFPVKLQPLFANQPIEAERDEHNPDEDEVVLKVREHLKGTKLIIVGGTPQPEMIARIQHAFELSEVVWPEYRIHSSLEQLRNLVRGENVSVLVQIVRLAGHAIGTLKPEIELNCGHFVRHSYHGYTPRLLARSIIEQLEHRLNAELK